MGDLSAAALAVREHAHAPIPRFKVGFTGGNVENATYSLTVCTERVAVFKAVSEGARPRDFVRIAVAADTAGCLTCRHHPYSEATPS